MTLKRKLLKIYYAPDGNTAGAGAENNVGNNSEPTERTAARYETQLPKEYQNDDFKGIDSLDKLYTEYRRLEKENKGTIKIITKDSTSEEVNDFYKNLGRPDNAGDYKLNDYDLDPKSIEKTKLKFQETCFDSGLNEEQAKALWRTVIASKQADIREQENKRNEAIETYKYRMDNRLKEEYPDDTKRAERIKLEENLYKEFASESGLGTKLADAGLTLDTEFMHKLAKFFESYSKITVTPQSQSPAADSLSSRYPTMV